jgi:hypothetical protein
VCGAGCCVVWCGVWRVVCGVWRVACGVWRVACGVWRVVCVSWILPRKYFPKDAYSSGADVMYASVY